MDSERNITEDYMGVLSDFAAFKNSYIEAHKNIKKLENFVALLREELRISRDAERTADFKKSCSQSFVVQQQEIINKLLGVEGENETLKQSLRQLQNTNNELVIKHKAELEKRDSELEQMKNTHMKEILLIRESTDEEVLKAKNESEATLNTLNMRCIELTSQIDFIKSEKEDTMNSTVQKYQEIITKLNENEMSLQAENKELKERSAANIAIFHKKLAEQERQHQAELETWKLAELNRNPPPQNNSFKPSNYPTNSNTMNQQYVTNPNIYQNQSFYQPQNHKPPLNIKKTKEMPKKTVTSYQTANEFYRQKRNAENTESEMVEEDTLPETMIEHLNINVNKSKPKFPAPVKKRKLYNSNNCDWLN